MKKRHYLQSIFLFFSNNPCKRGQRTALFSCLFVVSLGCIFQCKILKNKSVHKTRKIQSGLCSSVLDSPTLYHTSRIKALMFFRGRHNETFPKINISSETWFGAYLSVVLILIWRFVVGKTCSIVRQRKRRRRRRLGYVSPRVCACCVCCFVVV